MKIISLNDLPEEPVSHNPEVKKKTIIKKGTIPHLSNFGYYTFTPDQVALGHTHSDLYEIFYVESGEGVFIIDKKSQLLKQGECIVVEPGELHQVENRSAGNLILKIFSIEA